jgi:hypothetical protein
MSSQRHSAASSSLLRVETVVDARALGRAMFALIPTLVLALISGRPEWLTAAIVPVAMLIALDHSQLAPLGVVAHAMTISAGFVVLTASIAHPPLFVVATVLLGMGSVLVTASGNALHSLGNFTFIPSLYLASYSAEGVERHGLIARSVELLSFLLITSLPILLLASVEHFRSRETGRPTLAHFAKWTRLSPNSERKAYIEQMVTVALAVGCAAALVEWRHVEHGQWMMWSAASVVTGNAVSARQKFRNRLTGAIIGVSFGVTIGLLLPHAARARTHRLRRDVDPRLRSSIHAGVRRTLSLCGDVICVDGTTVDFWRRATAERGDRWRDRSAVRAHRICHRGTQPLIPTHCRD